MSWWCASTLEPWRWDWSPYLGVWVVFGALTLAYLVAVRRHTRRHGHDPAQRWRTVRFLLAIALLVAVSDWPIGSLGAAYLMTAHMLMFIVYTEMAAALILLATPEWMARRIVARLHLGGVIRFVRHPVAAGVIFNIAVIASAAPFVVDSMRATQLGSFALDMLWLVAGLILWLPLVSPLPEHRMRSVPLKAVYLFLTAQGLPMVPGGFMVFSEFPLYRTYELAPRVFSGFSALEDQQIAGVLMTVGNLPIVWTTIAAMFIGWAGSQMAADRARLRAVAAARADAARTA